ncbi:MAG: DMT family transporter [Actinomycetota bacterium]
MVIFLAVVTALLNALGSIMQRLGVEPQAGEINGGLVRRMLSQRVWLGGVSVMALGFATQVAALNVGSLTTVQPILVAELPFVVLVLWSWYGFTLSRRDVFSVAAMAIGLTGFLSTSSARAGVTSATTATWLATVLVAIALMAALTWGGGSRNVTRRAIRLATAAAMGFAVTAACTKVASEQLSNPAALVRSPSLYGLAIIGGFSFFLMQRAFETGSFAASQSTLILVNPIASMLLGAVLFGDTFRHGPYRVVVEIGELLTLGVGARLLATSPLVASEDGEGSLRSRGRYARWRADRLP